MGTVLPQLPQEMALCSTWVTTYQPTNHKMIKYLGTSINYATDELWFLVFLMKSEWEQEHRISGREERNLRNQMFHVPYTVGVSLLPNCLRYRPIRLVMCVHLKWTEVIKWLLPPTVVTDCCQHCLGCQSSGGQHFHGLCCSPMKEVSRCASLQPRSDKRNQRCFKYLIVLWMQSEALTSKNDPAWQNKIFYT